MKFIALKTSDGGEKGKIAFSCRVLDVSRQGFYKYLRNRDREWKHQGLADAINDILSEDIWNDTYGRKRMLQALELKAAEGLELPSERTIYTRKR